MHRRLIIVIASLLTVSALLVGYGCDDLVTESNTTIIFDYPEARFSASPTDGCTGTSVRFVDQSTPTLGITEWEWSFGDGDSALVAFVAVGQYSVSYSDGTSETLGKPDPSHVYDTAGLFEVSLTRTDTAAREDTEVKSRYVFIGGPIAEFTIDEGDTTLYHCPGEMIQFVNQSRGGINEYIWEIENTDSGTFDTSYRYQPDILFTVPGAYRVSLRAEGDCLPADIITVDSTIVIGECAFVDFLVNGGSERDTICQNETVTIDFTATGGAFDSVVFIWDDGLTNAVLASPVIHAYTDPGLYDITAKAYTGDRFVTETKLSSIILVRALAAATIAANPESGDAPLTVNFTGPVNQTLYEWDFGDGIGTSAVRSPTYTYDNPGTFDVRLVVNNDCGIPDTANITITVN
jgi:PKD repeat protein